MGAIDYLNTGNSGIVQTFGNEEVADSQIEAVEEQKREVSELLPSVKQILTVIDEEIAAVADIRAYMKLIGTRPTKAQIEQEYAARELFIGMAERLKTSIANKVADVEQEV
jgi:hypothetical protein